MVKWLEKLGIGQKRCSHCAAPFFPSSLGPDPLVETLCPGCLKLLSPKRYPLRCLRCALPLKDPLMTSPGRPLCRICRAEPPPWSGIACYDTYTGALRDLILRLKFDGQLHLAPTLGAFLLNSCSCLTRPDAIIPIPQYPNKLRRRGYNQAHEIARELCSQGSLPFRPQLLKRITGGAAQEGLTAAQRRKNMEKAFQAHHEAAGLAVWLIDDVFTSGSTARSAASALLGAGAASVQLLFVARTDYS